MDRILVVILMVLLTAASHAGSHRKDLHLNRTSASGAFTRSAWLDINLVKFHPNNRGGLANNETGNFGGGFWPDTLHPYYNVILYDCGPWVIGKVNGQPRMGISEWGTSYSAGPAINGKAAILARPQDSLRYRVYRISRGDNALSNPDYRDWPVDLGAPVDNQGKPRLYCNQTVWTVFNNLDTITTRGWWRSRMPLPGLPVVIQQTAYARGLPEGDTTSLLGNVAFIEWSIVNAGDTPIESTYFSLWTDIDFNEAFSNAPAIDTVNQLGYCWLSQMNAYNYTTPRAVGFVWLYGPSVPSAGSQAVYKGRLRADYRNLPVTSFWGILDDSYPDSSSTGPAYSIKTAWNIARGLDQRGKPIVDSFTHSTTKFPYSGDPVTGTGWLCPDFSGGGSGFNMFSGPFTLAPGDTQWVMVALIPAIDPDRLQCVTKLRQAAASLRAMPYDSLTQTGVHDEEQRPPLAFRLEQNYPNPFNALTHIGYSIRVASGQWPVASHVRLAVFDLLGREVAVLVDGEKLPGRYQVEFDGTKMSTGVYFYRLSVGDYVETKRMLLLR
jgi:hypothetical protein